MMSDLSIKTDIYRQYTHHTHVLRIQLIEPFISFSHFSSSDIWLLLLFVLSHKLMLIPIKMDLLLPQNFVYMTTT